MKYTAAFAIWLLFSLPSSAQTVTYDDFRGLIPYVQSEDYKAAFNASRKILESTVNDSSDLRGIVTYMHLYASAGMVSKGEMTNVDFEKNAKQYIGHYLVMSAHPCVDSGKMAYNSVKLFTDNDGTVKGQVTTTNKAATSILFFEYFKFAEPVDPSRYVGKNVRCGGILEDLKPNVNSGSTLLIGRLYLRQAFIREMAPR